MQRAFRVILLGLLLPSLAWAEQSAPQPVRHDDGVRNHRHEPARRAAQRGIDLFNVRDFEGALLEFERAYSLWAGHPKQFWMLDNIGRCHEQLLRYDRALDYYRRYLREGGAGATDRAAVEATIATLERLLGTLVVRSNVPVEIWVDDRQVSVAAGKVRIPSGRHAVELRAPGFETSKLEVIVAAGQTTTVERTLDSLSTARGLEPWYFHGGVALTVGALGAGTYFGMRAQSEHDSAIERRERDGSLANLVSDEERIRRLALTADLFFAGAAVLGVGSTLLYFMTDWQRESTESRSPRKVALTPLASPTAAGVSVGGRF